MMPMLKKPVRQPEGASMCSLSGSVRFVLSVITVLTFVGVAAGQRQTDQEFGPVVTAYLGYLNNEQEVVDDRASRREITPGYYRRNSNRIHALRQTALRLVRQSGNDYVPELEAVYYRKVVSEFEAVEKTGTAAITVDGKLVDYAMYQRARRVLDLAKLDQ